MEGVPANRKLHVTVCPPVPQTPADPAMAVPLHGEFPVFSDFLQGGDLVSMPRRGQPGRHGVFPNQTPYVLSGVSERGSDDSSFLHVHSE